MSDGASLQVYDAACAAIAKAYRVDEVKEIRDRAEAWRAYARQAKNRELEVNAAEIRMRAERRLGELIVAQKALPREQGGGLNRGASAGAGPGRGKRGAQQEPRFQDPTPTLAELGIDKKLSSRAQALAKVPERRFEAELDEWRERIQKATSRVTTTVMRSGNDRPRKVAKKPEPDPFRADVAVSGAVHAIKTIIASWPDDVSIGPLVRALKAIVQSLEKRSA